MSLKEHLDRTRQLKNNAILDSLVMGHEEFVKSLSLKDPDNRHFLAAAIRSDADIVNLWSAVVGDDFAKKGVRAYVVDCDREDLSSLSLVSLKHGNPVAVCTACHLADGRVHALA